MLTVVSMLTALVGGATISAVLAGLTISDWVAIAGLLLKAGEDAVKLFTALHPELKKLEADLLAKKSAEEIAHKTQTLSWDVPSVDDPSKWGGENCLT